MTLLGILADLNGAVIWVVSIRLRIFRVFQSLYQSFGQCTKNTNYNWYDLNFHILHYFQFSSKIQVLILLFTFFQFYSVVSRDRKVHNSASSLFFFLVIIRSGRLTELYDPFVPQISEEFVCHILQNIFWAVHIPFGSMVRIQFLAQFPVDHLDYPVVCSLIHILC